MMLKWDDYRKELLGAIRDMEQISPAKVRGYHEVSDSNANIGRLDAKTRELIALAVAVTRQCDRCITVHADGATKHGATPEEIMEALGIAIAVNAGATLVYSTRVMDTCAARAADSAH
jgi:AhpD family alkylhydroperoxidase